MMKGAWALILIAAAGCVDLKAAYPDRRFYAVEVTRSGAERPTWPDTVMRVRRFNASKMCDGTEFVSRTSDSGYETDYYSALFFPPAQQMAEQTYKWLTASKLYKHVVGAGSSLPETHTLEGNLIALHGDYRKSGAPVAVLEIQFMLVRVTTEPSSLVYQKTYRQEIALLSTEPAALVKGWSEGLTNVLTALEQDLAKVK